MKNKKILPIKKLSLLGICFFFTNFLSINFLKKVDFKNTYISGSEFISISDITQNSSLQLPRRLIFIKTKLIEKELKQNLAIKQISINRQIFPFGLNIKIQTRKPVAFANRKENGIKIEGFVDKDGHFIDKNFPEIEKLTFPIKVKGWNEDYKKLISLILKKYEDNDDLIIAAVNIWEETEGRDRDQTIQEYFGDSFIDLPIVLDVDNEMATNLGITGLPSQAFIDKEGKLQFVDAGFIDDEAYYRDFEDKIDLLLQKR